MTIAKLTIPAIAEIPAKINELVDAANAGGGFTAATGAEINAGTDNTKGATPLAIKDSNIIMSSDDTVRNIRTLTKAQYLALSPPDPNTIYITTDEIETSLVDGFVSATAGSNGDFYITTGTLLATNNIYYISFPAATNGASNARLSVDGGITYKNIKLSTIRLASEVASRKLSFVYDGTDFVPLETEYFPITYNPTVTSGAGTLTSYTATGSYVKIGKSITFHFRVEITAVGTGSYGLIIPLPIQPVSRSCGSAVEDQTVGYLCSVNVNPNVAYAIVARYDNNPTLGTNYRFSGSVTYLVA